MITDEQLKKFLAQVDVLQSVNFPDIARTQGLNWFKDIKPLLKTTDWFREALKESLETIKYELIQRMMIPAKEGKSKHLPTPEISYIKAIVSLIDDGTLLGLSESEVRTQEPNLTPEQEAEHRRRLGLDEKVD